MEPWSLFVSQPSGPRGGCRLFVGLLKGLWHADELTGRYTTREWGSDGS